MNTLYTKIRNIYKAIVSGELGIILAIFFGSLTMILFLTVSGVGIYVLYLAIMGRI